MANIDWPSNVTESPLLNSLQEGVASSRVRTNMSVGTPKMRPRSTAGIPELTFKLMIPKSEADALVVFYEDTLVQGTARFNFTHPRTGNTVEARFKKSIGLRPVSSDLFEIDVTLEVLP